MKILRSIIVLAAISLAAGSLCAQSVNRQAALTTTVTVKSTYVGLYGWTVFNPNASVCVLDLFNTGSVVLGTTVPYLSIALPASGISALRLNGIPMQKGLSMAAVTVTGGNTLCGTGMVVNLFYQ